MTCSWTLEGHQAKPPPRVAPVQVVVPKSGGSCSKRPVVAAQALLHQVPQVMLRAFGEHPRPWHALQLRWPVPWRQRLESQDSLELLQGRLHRPCH